MHRMWVLDFANKCQSITSRDTKNEYRVRSVQAIDAKLGALSVTVFVDTTDMRLLSGSELLKYLELRDDNPLFSSAD